MKRQIRGEALARVTLLTLKHIFDPQSHIGELLSGFKAGNRKKENRKELGEFLDSPRVRLYPVDIGTAEYYSSILNQLKNQGTPIPTNDIWIAAVAFQHGLELYTLDNHFQKITGLLLR